MGFKPNDGVRLYDISQMPDPTFNKEQFVEAVFNEEYILVVGNEVVMNKNEEPTGDVNSYILRLVNDSLGQQYKDFNELALHSGQGFDPIRNLLNNHAFSFDINDISPELTALLSTKLFPIVLTTTFDSYIETLMRHIWGDRLRVVNFDDMNSLRDFRNAISGYRNGRSYNEPTLFYIFGKAVREESKKYVHTDDDAIQIIEKWMQLPKEDPVLNLVRSKKVLALGCKFDNWYFRFFWYILKREISRFGEGQVAFMLDANNQVDNKLGKFLKHSRIYRHNDARTFMSDIAKLFSSADENNPFIDIIVEKRRRGGVFLSYCSKDNMLASQLFFMLRKHGYNVWFDNSSLYGGDNYNTEIEKALGESKVVISLLTPNVAYDLENGNLEEKYYVKEWKKASQIGEKRIIPLAVDGYDLRAHYHVSVYENIVNNALSGIDLMQKDGLTKLQSSLDKELSNGGGYYE